MLLRSKRVYQRTHPYTPKPRRQTTKNQDIVRPGKILDDAGKEKIHRLMQQQVLKDKETRSILDLLLIPVLSALILEYSYNTQEDYSRLIILLDMDTKFPYCCKQHFQKHNLLCIYLFTKWWIKDLSRVTLLNMCTMIEKIFIPFFNTSWTFRSENGGERFLVQNKIQILAWNLKLQEIWFHAGEGIGSHTFQITKEENHCLLQVSPMDHADCKKEHGILKVSCHSDSFLKNLIQILSESMKICN